MDVDFVPAEELSRIFSGRQEYQSTLVYLYNNAVIVLPAFETLQGAAEGQTLALKLAKGAATKRSESLLLAATPAFNHLQSRPAVGLAFNLHVHPCCA